VNRILQELGWDIYDPSVVRREFPLEKGRVDYALFTSSVAPVVLIEAKAPSSGEDGTRQLFTYAFHQGTPFVILANGREWSFYLPAEQGNYAERRVQKFDLLERNSKDSASVLEKYLRFDRVQDGTAHADARTDYQSAARQRDAEKAIPRAWRELVSLPDELLIELIAEKVVSLIGFRPTDEQIEAFLLAPEASVQPQQASRLTTIQRTGSSRDLHALSGHRGVSLRFLGQVTNQPDAISALMFLLRKLAERDSQFLRNFAKLAPGRSRNHVSTNRSQVYPGKPELETYTAEIAQGWWLGTNIANREKERLAKIACEVAALRFGEDVVIEFPNAAS